MAFQGTVISISKFSSWNEDFAFLFSIFRNFRNIEAHSLEHVRLVKIPMQIHSDVDPPEI